MTRTLEITLPDYLSRVGDVTGVLPKLGEIDLFAGIRCPQCEWRPDTSSRWCCQCDPADPEPFFRGCGTVWNTFATRGRCPGCSHEWQWTSCLRCEGWSPHADWYENG